jgi:hypothetical protein
VSSALAVVSVLISTFSPDTVTSPKTFPVEVPKLVKSPAKDVTVFKLLAVVDVDVTNSLAVADVESNLIPVEVELLLDEAVTVSKLEPVANSPEPFVEVSNFESVVNPLGVKSGKVNSRLLGTVVVLARFINVDSSRGLVLLMIAGGLSDVVVLNKKENKY